MSNKSNGSTKQPSNKTSNTSKTSNKSKPSTTKQPFNKSSSTSNKPTNMPKVKEMALNFLMLTPTPDDTLPFIVHHPYFDNRMLPKVGNRAEFFDILEDIESLSYYRNILRDDINKATTVTDILARMLTKYHLTFLKYIHDYVNHDEFDKILAEVWFTSENPNQDINVPVRTIINWFKKADRKNLMIPEEYNYYMSLPKQVHVYRGVANGRAASKGLSWTCNLSTAQWFASRFGPGGYVIEGLIDKNDIFAYFNRRGEDEILCNSSKVQILR